MAEVLDDAEEYVADDRWENAKKLDMGEVSKSLPDISVAAPRDPKKERKGSAVSLPAYVWTMLRQKSGNDEEPVNVIIMRGLRELGFEIDDDDLIDPRKLRYMKK